MKKMLKISLLLVLLMTLPLFNVQTLLACTRVVYKGPNGSIITARSMDWKSEIPANIWLLPRGTERNGEVGTSSVKRRSRYGSIVATAWDIATADGMNEKGLVANMLWLGETDFPKFEKNSTVKGLAVSLWAQYVLDNFATVDEAVNEFTKEEFVIVSDYIPGSEQFATVHLSISDATGDNAVIEYIKGKLVLHHNRAYKVMTNSPVYEDQLAINKYWQGIPGTIMLPGTNRAADRFVRASYYIDAILQTDDPRIAVASVFSVIRNCSVPFGISSKDEPNISSTRWRSVSDQKNLVYYFETVLTPNTFWIDMKKMDFSEKTFAKKLNLMTNETYSGETSGKFVATKAFKFLGI
jgi:penicillin V acylase-like amidase (Ntn superfamily)